MMVLKYRWGPPVVALRQQKGHLKGFLLPKKGGVVYLNAHVMGGSKD